MNSPSDLIGKAFAPRTIAGFSMDQLSRYSLASGDHNPIHLDPDLARSVGLADCAVHGMLIAGQFEQTILLWKPEAELIASSIRFVRPAICKQPHVISGRIVAVSDIARAGVIARLDVRNSGRQVVCLADIHLRLG